MGLFTPKVITTEKTVIKNDANAKTKLEDKIKNLEKKEDKPTPTLKDKLKDTKQKIKEHHVLENEIGKLVNNWKDIMGNCKILNEELHTYTLSHIKKEDKYGWSCRVYAPNGLPLQKLESYKDEIDSGLKCQTIIKVPEHNQFAMLQIVYPNQVKCNEIPFEPLKVKPYEFYGGVDVSGTPVVFNVNKTPHILLAGQNRRGKNGSIDHAIMSWVCSCEPEEIELYLIQCAKNDFSKYEHCRQVRCYVEQDLNKTLKTLDYLAERMKERTKLLKPMVASLKGDNVFHYNKLHPHKKQSYIYLIIDEFIALMIDNKVDGKEVKEIKGKILNHIQSICQYGGALGVNVAILHQKPEKELCPSFVKNQCNIRICYGFEDRICCQIVLGEELAKMAHKLPQRKAYYSNDEHHGYLYTTNLEDRREMFLRPHMKYDNRNIFDNMKLAEKNQVESDVSNINQSKVKIKESNKGSVVLKSEVDIKSLPKVTVETSKKEEVEKEITEKEKIISSIKPLEDKPNEVVADNTATPTVPTVQMDFSKVDPKVIQDKQSEYVKNIKNIPNFVPYVPNKNTIIIDKTMIDLSKTEKAKKDIIKEEGEK